MICVMLYLGHGFLGFQHNPPHRTGRHAKSGSQRFHREFQFVLAVWRKQCTGTFLASKGEQRISCDTLQWTDRYLIPSGSSLAPSAPLNFHLAISTRSLCIPTAGPHGRCRSTLLNGCSTYSKAADTALSFL